MDVNQSDLPEWEGRDRRGRLSASDGLHGGVNVRLLTAASFMVFIGGRK